MDLAQIPAALARLWDQLPAAVGADWQTVFPVLARNASALADATDDDQRALLALALVETLAAYPSVIAPLAEIAAPTRAPRPLTSWSTGIAALQGRLHPPSAEGILEVHAPERLTVGARDYVVVDLADVGATPGLRAALTAGTADFTVDGPPDRPLGDEPTAFRITALSPGAKQLRVDLRQDGRVVGGLGFPIQVDDGDPAPATFPRRASTAVAVGGAYLPPPDLELRVHLVQSAGAVSLRYVLHSPSGVVGHHHDPAGETLLVTSPENFRDNLLIRIEGLPPERAEDKLRAYGEMLYRDLLTPQLRAAYQRFRASVRTLQIVSDEPWIPWELVRPYDDGPAAVDDDFWGAHFAMARWLPGDCGPGTDLRLRRLVCLAAGGTSGRTTLPAAAREQRAVSALATSHGLHDRSPHIADIDTVHRLLADATVDAWHFATHGDSDPRQPDQAALVLADGETLSPEDLFGRRQTAIRSARPVVFLNACRTGELGLSLVRLGGWADAWVRRCQAGAFIGPVWSVADTIALSFATTFYEHLLTGQTLSESMRAAREATRSSWPGSLAWLAYTLYGHPNARATVSPPLTVPGDHP